MSVFSYQAIGITVTQAAVAAMPEAPALQLYVESSGDFRNGRSSGSLAAESVFLYFANGGGYTTQFLNGATMQVANGKMVFVGPN
jgi:hypothetical protein